VNETEVTGSGFVVACGQAARAFELVEASLHAVSQGIGNAIDRDRLFAIGLAWNDWRTATPGNHIADMIAVITAIGDEHTRVRKIVIHKCVKAFEIGDLTAAHFRPDRLSVSVGNEVDFGRVDAGPFAKLFW
jgi:hypothetical protein